MYSREGVIGLTRTEMRQYIHYVADQRLLMLGLPAHYGARKPVLIHGVTGCAGIDQFLRAQGFRLPGRRAGRSGISTKRFDHGKSSSPLKIK